MKSLSGTSCHRCVLFFFSSRRRHTRFDCDWSSDVCSSDLDHYYEQLAEQLNSTVSTTSDKRAIKEQLSICGAVLSGSEESQFHTAQSLILRSEERRVGKECRSRWSPYH